MDIKSALYAALGRRKLGTPDYKINQENRGGRQRFRCELRVSNINYIGLGNSTNKKDAQTNAAKDFGAYLIRENILNANDLPQFMESSFYGTSTILSGETSYANTSYEMEQNSNFNLTLERNLMTSQDRVNDQKFEEVLRLSETIDLTADIHGGWTLENSRQALNEYLQKNRQPAADLRVVSSGNDHAKSFTAICSVYIPVLGQSICGNGHGSSKKMAQTLCSLSIVRQLFHLGLLGRACDKSASKKNSPAELPPISVNVSDSLRDQIENYLQKVNIKPVCNFEVGKPQSLLIDQKLNEYPIMTSYPVGYISWCPSIPNWNPWRASTIDDKSFSMTMEEISKDLYMREKMKDIPVSMAEIREKLPVFNYKEEILKVVAKNSVVLIKGSTGCGKSTQICQYLLESYILDKRGANFNCYVSQPRRISAITLAERVASERCEQLGESIGFSVRFEGVNPRPYGAIMFVTVGVLMRKMESGIRGVSHIIVDEIHERDINTDFLLIIIRDLVRTNPNLKVILMSATIDTSLFTRYFGQICNVPIIEMEHRTHPVKHYFLEDVIRKLKYMPPIPEVKKEKKKKRIEVIVNEDEEVNEEAGTNDEKYFVDDFDELEPEVKLALSRMNERDIPIDLIELLLMDIVTTGQPGAILIFLPGWSVISMLQANLQRHPVFSNAKDYLILPLHSQLTGKEQHRVFESVGPNMRKIILSTNIAETSVTIDDVVYVIDSCRAREKIYSSRNNMVHFATNWASRNNLIQRRGRAGRVQEGFCYHLCTKARFNNLEENRLAEMLRTPLHEVALTIKLLRLGSVSSFLEKAVECPPLDAVIEAEVLLREMGALDHNLELTPLGRILARLPIEPKIGKTIILATALGIGDIMCTLAAASSFNSPFVPRERFYTKLAKCHRFFSGTRFSDHLGLLSVNQKYVNQVEFGSHAIEEFCLRNSLSSTILNMSAEAKRQLCEVLINYSNFPASSLLKYDVDVLSPDPMIDLFLSLLVYAYYPNICHLDGKGKRKVFTLEQATALLSKQSVCVPLNIAEILPFTSPLCVFTEKLRTNVISCKQISMITPLQLLLFGSRKVERINEKSVRLDDMITLKMDAYTAALIVALRPCIEALIVRVCIHPKSLEMRSEQDLELIEIFKQISSATDWICTDDNSKLENHMVDNKSFNVNNANFNKLSLSVNDNREKMNENNEVIKEEVSNYVPINVIDEGGYCKPFFQNFCSHESFYGVRNNENYGGNDYQKKRGYKSFF